MLKPVLCAAALAVSAAVAIPAIAQQSSQGPDPQAAPNAQPTPEERGPRWQGRGPGWRGYPERGYSDDEGRGGGWRRWDEGRRNGDEDGPPRWRERRFGGPREGMMPPGMMGRGAMMDRGAGM